MITRELILPTHEGPPDGIVPKFDNAPQAYCWNAVPPSGLNQYCASAPVAFKSDELVAGLL